MVNRTFKLLRSFNIFIEPYNEEAYTSRCYDYRMVTIITSVILWVRSFSHMSAVACWPQLLALKLSGYSISTFNHLTGKTLEIASGMSLCDRSWYSWKPCSWSHQVYPCALEADTVENHGNRVFTFAWEDNSTRPPNGFLFQGIKSVAHSLQYLQYKHWWVCNILILYNCLYNILCCICVNWRQQMVMWLDHDKLPENISDNDSFNPDGVYGAILPRIITAGTVTRRAVEKTWLTASNAKVCILRLCEPVMF